MSLATHNKSFVTNTHTITFLLLGDMPPLRFTYAMRAKGAKSTVESAVSVANVARDEGRIVNSSG